MQYILNDEGFVDSSYPDTAILTLSPEQKMVWVPDHIDPEPVPNENPDEESVDFKLPDMTAAEWELIATKFIEREHAEALRRFTGDQTIEERDTWERQAKWAEQYRSETTAPARKAQVTAFLTGILIEPELMALDAAGVDPAEYMATKIEEKSLFNELLIVEAGNAKRQAYLALEMMKNSVPHMQGFLQSLVLSKADREQAFLAKMQAMSQ